MNFLFKVVTVAMAHNIVVIMYQTHVTTQSEPLVVLK